MDNIDEPVVNGTAENGNDHIIKDERPPHIRLRSSSGWDGKLRMEPRNAVLANPEALSDPDYSDPSTLKVASAIVFGQQWQSKLPMS